MRLQKYFISYTSQTTINDVLFHNEIINTNDPLQWINQKNAEDSKIKYALIKWGKIEGSLPRPRTCTITYVTQNEIGDSLFKTEEIHKKNPITWIIEKNTNSKIKYTLINWWPV